MMILQERVLEAQRFAAMELRELGWKEKKTKKGAGGVRTKKGKDGAVVDFGDNDGEEGGDNDSSLQVKKVSHKKTRRGNRNRKGGK